MSNKVYDRYIRQGYAYTGITGDDKAEVSAKADKYRMLGNKVFIALKTDEYPVRGGGTHSNTYWAALLLKSDAYKTKEYADRVTRKKAEHEDELMTIAGQLTMDDIAFIIRFKGWQMAEHPEE